MLSPEQIDLAINSFSNENFTTEGPAFEDTKAFIEALSKSKEFGGLAGETLRRLRQALPPLDAKPDDPEVLFALLRGVSELSVILRMGYTMGQMAAAEAAKETTNA